MAYYPIRTRFGLDSVSSNGDGYAIQIKWYKAYPSIRTNKIAYGIYFSTSQYSVFDEGVKYISTDESVTSANLQDMTPGELYFFSVRPIEYDPDLFDFSQLPEVNGFKYYPTTILRSAISDTDLTIPLVDVSEFPSNGILKIGIELIQYSTRDLLNNNLELNLVAQRGYNNTKARSHDVDGYDGYVTHDPTVSYYIPGESSEFDKIIQCQSRFEFDNYSYTEADGYKQVIKDLLSTDLAGSDAANVDFPTYDYAGWRRTDPKLLLDGSCVGSYFGGYMFCADGYSGVGTQLRGLSVQDHNNQRQEYLLNVDGEPVCLLKRMRTGIVCSCYLPSQEYSDYQCPKCFGSKFVVSYEQYFNPRRSDGRILVRFSPSEEKLKMYESGMESEFTTECWTLTVPTIKDRDILVRFDMDGNEEYRYEVLGVTRNRMLNSMQGGQKVKVQRIRKYDQKYKIPVFHDSSTIPSILTTGVGSTNGIAAHIHEVKISENITNISQINQLTTVVSGHNHIVRNGVVQATLGHTHTLIL